MRVSRALMAAALLVGSAGIVTLPTDVAGADVTVASVAAGVDFTCAVTAAGGAKCWGSDSDGQLGDGANGVGVTRVAPVGVTGLGSGVAAVAAGFSACALTTGGAVKCWGFGPLGNGSSSPSNVPVGVTGLGSGVAAITAGDENACALTSGGGVKCWGDNTFGELGNGTTTQSNNPVDVTGLGSGVAAISTGGAYTCALTTGGAVKCWGYNQDGRLGDGTRTTRLAPVDVSGLSSGVAAISAGEGHACALLINESLKCWGKNDRGQLGDGTKTTQLVPTDAIGPGSGITAVTAGGYNTCVIDGVGAASCWGRNDYGQLGNATTDPSLSPVAVSGLGSGVVAMSAGITHACALTADGALHCWGYNGDGELGDGAASQQPAPVAVAGLDSGIVAIGAGYQHSCASSSGGALKCWGLNDFGQLGDGTTIERDTPADVPALGTSADSVVGGVAHTCVVTTSGALKCWGRNSSGQVGDGTTSIRHAPVTVSGLGSDVASVSAGGLHTCAVTVDGALACWGYNSQGEVGDNTNTTRVTPTGVSGLGSGVAAVAAGAEHTCALTTGGAVKCWGSGGNLGDGTTQPSNVPVAVSGLGSGVAAIAAGADDTCALTTGGAVKCWGENPSGFAGTPASVPGLASGVAAISAGASFMCALTTGGGVKCWGYNGNGALGNGTTDDSTTPVDVSGLGSGVVAIAARGDHTCAVLASGAVKCWGYNGNGQLGSGAAGHSLVPVGVVGLGLGGASIPGAPSGLQAAPNDRAATISWNAPTRTGGAHVYGYAVSVLSADGGKAAGVSGASVRTTSSTAIHFTGLTNGTSYRLDVSPLNRAGAGASALSSIVTPGTHAPVASTGYWMVGATGSVYSFGHVTNYGSESGLWATHIEVTPTGRGYWIVDAAGSVFPFGDASRLGGAGTLAPGEVVTSLSSTRTGHGYWLFTNFGRVINRGNARFFGDVHTVSLNGPIVGSVATPTGHGYYLLGSDGGVFTFGDARFQGSLGGVRLNKPAVGIVPTSDNGGYWLVASDGGVFTFGAAKFRGSMGAIPLNQPVIGMIRYGNGYLMAASDGGVFDFSNKPFAGSLGAHPPARPIVAIAATG
jgi:alpha-tubulin suppressor-like RCC1 family protein